jgi:hypothetical protein
MVTPEPIDQIEILFLEGIPFITDSHRATWSVWDIFITLLLFPVMMKVDCIREKKRTVNSLAVVGKQWDSGGLKTNLFQVIHVAPLHTILTLTWW